MTTFLKERHECHKAAQAAVIKLCELAEKAYNKCRCQAHKYAKGDYVWVQRKRGGISEKEGRNNTGTGNGAMGGGGDKTFGGGGAQSTSQGQREGQVGVRSCNSLPTKGKRHQNLCAAGERHRGNPPATSPAQAGGPTEASTREHHEVGAASRNQGRGPDIIARAAQGGKPNNAANANIDAGGTKRALLVHCGGTGRQG